MKDGGKQKNQYISSSLSDTNTLAQEFLAYISENFTGSVFVGLSGNLGAGKTTFMKFLAKALGVRETVVSPTFILERRYQIKKHPHFKNLIHIDAYRFADEEESHVLNLTSFVEEKNNLVCVEWPELIDKNIKLDVVLKFEVVDEMTRKISW